MGGCDNESICSDGSSFSSKCNCVQNCQLCNSTKHLAPACPLLKEDSVQHRCQICNHSDHLAPKCIFMNTACKNGNCDGIRKILVSGTEKNPDRIFLKCHNTKCGSFQWLDDAVQETKGSVGSSSSPKQHRANGCFGCGETDHWKHQCPYIGSPKSKSTTPARISLDICAKFQTNMNIKD